MLSNCCTLAEQTDSEGDNMIVIYNTCSKRVQRGGKHSEFEHSKSYLSYAILIICVLHLSLSHPQLCRNCRLSTSFLKYKNVKWELLLLIEKKKKNNLYIVQLYYLTDKWVDKIKGTLASITQYSSTVPQTASFKMLMKSN